MEVHTLLPKVEARCCLYKDNAQSFHAPVV